MQPAVDMIGDVWDIMHMCLCEVVGNVAYLLRKRERNIDENDAPTVKL